ncbi:MAG: RecX family transcriptional regulator [Anaerolineae bacterium]
MAGKITALKWQKRNKQRVNVYLDGEFAFGLAATQAAKLQVGARLSDRQIAELQALDAVEKAHDRALNYLSYRPRSEAEIQRYLREKEFSEETIEETLERLRRVGLVDDLEFAHYWINNRLRFRPRGRRALRQELRQKGIANKIIEQVLSEFDEERALQKALQRHARRLQHLSSEKFRQRLTQRLARRGFSYEAIREALDTYLASNDNAPGEITTEDDA